MPPGRLFCRNSFFKLLTFLTSPKLLVAGSIPPGVANIQIEVLSDPLSGKNFLRLSTYDVANVEDAAPEVFKNAAIAVLNAAGCSICGVWPAAGIVTWRLPGMRDASHCVTAGR